MQEVNGHDHTAATDPAEVAAEAVANGPDAERAAEMLAAAVQEIDDRPQTTLPNVGLDLLDASLCPPGQRILVIQNRHQIYLVPMSIDAAITIGGRLAAPTVAVARTDADIKAEAQRMGMPR